MTTKEIARGYKGMGMEGPIATWYAKNGRRNRADFERDARRIAAQVPPPARILEVAPGPGYLSVALAQLGGYEVHALDISESFVEIARQEAATAGVEVDIRLGNVAAMPYPDSMFDYIVCRSAFKNFADPVGALDEMHRVLVPGGAAQIQDLLGGATPAAVDAVVDTWGHNPANRWLMKWIFHNMLLKRAYTPEAFADMAARSRFGGAKISTEGITLEVWLEKPA
jgi:ubiquinone/menaquinone biosynthesis C-methylase UbiE